MDPDRAGEHPLGAFLPPELAPLFDRRFVRSCELLEEYSFRLALEVAERTGLSGAMAAAGTIDEIAERAGFAPGRSTVPLRWILRSLAERGLVLVGSGTGAPERFRRAAPWPAVDPEETLREQRRHDVAALPAFAIAKLAASEYPRFLRGEATGEEILFGPGRTETWEAYFANENPLYAISNAVGAIAAEHALPPRGGEVLELGGGLGSGAAALLARLVGTRRMAAVGRYRFTEVSIPFLRRAQKRLQAEWPGAPLTFGRLDMNRPFAEGGIPSGAAAVVYGVNTLHVADDLGFTLREIHRALGPEGTLVISECVRPFEGRPIYVELVFNLLRAFQSPRLHPVWRPNGGFLTPEQWTAALSENGFADVRVVPDVAALRDAIPSFVVAAVSARRA